MEAVHPEHRNDVRSAWRRWLAGEGNERLDMTFRIVRPDGETRWIHSRGTLIRDARGKPYRGSGIAADITEERRAQEALAKAQMELAHVSRLTTLGELTTSIAHEVSQPLAGMMASAGAGARWLAAEPPDIAAARAALDSIAADGKRAREVIARIRALTKRQVPRKDRSISTTRFERSSRSRSRSCAATTSSFGHELDRTAAARRRGPRAAAAGAAQPDRERDRGDERRPRSPTPSDDRFSAARQRECGASRGARFRHRSGPRGRASRCSMRSTRPSPTASASACRSAARSSRRTAGGSGRAANEPHGAVFQLSLPVAEEGQP